VIYLDGNSLGAQPRAVPARVAAVVAQQWGRDLITSWNKAGWFALPRRVGDRIAPWIGAQAGQVVAADTTSINLYKALSAALSIARQQTARAAWWSASAATSPPTCTSPRPCAASAAARSS
jgi:kynureninase